MNFSEATTGVVLGKKLFFKFLQYSQESCRPVTLLFHDRGPYHIGTNQSIDLLSKLIDWFLYDRDIRH